MPKKVLVALAPGLLEEIDHVASAEHRTRSDLIREALRRYLENFRRRNSYRDYSTEQQPSPQSANRPELTGPGGRTAADTFADPRSTTSAEGRRSFYLQAWSNPGQPERTNSAEGSGSNGRNVGPR